MGERSVGRHEFRLTQRCFPGLADGIHDGAASPYAVGEYHQTAGFAGSQPTRHVSITSLNTAAIGNIGVFRYHGLHRRSDNDVIAITSAMADFRKLREFGVNLMSLKRPLLEARSVI
jgi:hypothetical protein